MMRNLFIVSYPRSGQHYCQRLLERVSGVDSYCEVYNCRVEDCPGKNLKVSERTPCPAGMRIQKSHDFDLKFPVLDGARYAILIRQPIHSIISYYEHSSRRGDGVRFNGELYPDNMDSLQKFCKVKAEYWKAFVTKWLRLAETNNNLQFFDYTKLVSDKSTMIRFCDFALEYYPRDVADKLADRQARLFSEGVVGQGKIKDFHFSTDSLVKIAEDTIGYELLRRAGLETFV